MHLIIFHLNCNLLLKMKMNRTQFLFHSRKIRAVDSDSPGMKISTQISYTLIKYSKFK